MQEIDPNKAIDYITKYAPIYADAKGTRIRTEEYRKSKKAELMLQAPTEVLGKQETFAYAHPEYIAVLDDLKRAVVIEEEMRWMMIAAQARIEVWKTNQYNTRAELKALN